MIKFHFESTAQNWVHSWLHYSLYGQSSLGWNPLPNLGLSVLNVSYLPLVSPLKPRAHLYQKYWVTIIKIWKFLSAITMKLCVSDLMLVKPIFAWELLVFSIFKNLFTIFSSQMHFGFINIGSKMFANSNGYNSEIKYVWPLVGKAKMHLRTIQFLFSKILFTFSAVCLQKIENWIVLKHILALPPRGQKGLLFEL